MPLLTEGLMELVNEPRGRSTEFRDAFFAAM